MYILKFFIFNSDAKQNDFEKSYNGTKKYENILEINGNIFVIIKKIFVSDGLKLILNRPKSTFEPSENIFQTVLT